MNSFPPWSASARDGEAGSGHHLLEGSHVLFESSPPGRHEDAMHLTVLTVHVKNGWLPRATHGWRIHSIGTFTGRGGGYSIVVLTQDNPTMAYGIDTIEAIARAINRDLNPAARSRIPSSEFSPSWGTPDESVPTTAEISGAR